MRPVAVGVAGRIGSGKTTLAHELAARMDCAYASFGDYVRHVARERGIDCGRREVLQAIGDELIAVGWPSFCRAVLNFSGYARGSVVVDGVRHVEAIHALARIVHPLPFRLVAVSVDSALRSKRLQARGIGVKLAEAVEAHATESAVCAVVDLADYTVEGGLTIEEAAETAYQFLRRDLQRISAPAIEY